MSDYVAREFVSVQRYEALQAALDAANAERDLARRKWYEWKKRAQAANADAEALAEAIRPFGVHTGGMPDDIEIVRAKGSLFDAARDALAAHDERVKGG